MNRDEQEVGDRLRRHDPARGCEGLESAEGARMRQSVIEAARRAAGEGATAGATAARGGAAWFLLPRPVLAGVLAVALVAAVALVLIRRNPSRPMLPSDAETAGAARDLAAVPPGSAAVTPGSPAHVVRQVHIDTPGGTRVVWVLNSDFKL